VKKTRIEEVPLASIERNPLFLLISALLAAGLVFLTFQTLFNKEVWQIEPLSFFLFVPTLVVSFQALWYMLNPFAYVYADKFEIKRSIFQTKFRHFVDIKNVGEVKGANFNIQYNDDEVERLNMFEVKTSHRTLLREEVKKRVEENLKVRA
jgi:hypothetical protein